MMSRLHLSSILLLLAMCVGACSHGFVSPYGVRGLRVQRPIFEVVGMRLADSTVRLSFTTIPRLRTMDPTIRGVSAAIGPSEDYMPDTVDFDLGLSGHPSTDEVINVVGDLIWDTPTARTANEVWVDVSVLTATDHLVFKDKVEFVPAVPLELIPFAQPGSDGTIELGMHVKRIFVPRGEYLPSSERFRIIITDSTGSVVWRSDAGVSHSTIVLNVEPQTPSEKERMSLKWDGKMLSGMPAQPGRYKADLIIPSKPSTYQSSVEFLWPPSR